MAEDVTFEIFRGIGSLPHFDDATQVHKAVEAFRTKIKEADAVLICTPEYAFGVPGSLKNALDWTVSSGEFMGKPVGLITASSLGENGHAAMLLILTAIASNIVDDATLLISAVRTKLDKEGQIKDATVRMDLKRVLHQLVKAAARK